MLTDERQSLQAGHDIAPPLPATRDASARETSEGAPLWRLVDFRDTMTAPQRAGLEAALEAAGLLDAWISPDGRLQFGGDGATLYDTQFLQRQNTPLSLADWLDVNLPSGCTVPTEVVERVLSGCACADDDPIGSEAWVAVDGRFRLGALSGAWGKPVAAYIGPAARAAARVRRLGEIADRLAQLSGALANIRTMAEQLALDRAQADDEWCRAPSDEMLRSAHLAAAASASAARLASERLAGADTRCREAEQALMAVRNQLAADAADLRLPASPASLQAVETELDDCRDTHVRLEQAAHELRLALPEWRRQRTREACRATISISAKRSARLPASRRKRPPPGFMCCGIWWAPKSGELQFRLAEARGVVETGDAASKRGGEALGQAGEMRAVANQQAETASAVLQQSGDSRARAISGLQQFAGTGLMSAALPHVELPDTGLAWTIDPALTLARRAEQELSHLKDDDDTRARVQRQISEELTELQRALGALGHQVQADPTDWGFSVSIIYQNRRERPNRLAMLLAGEIAQRDELLTANERTVLENHLQAEIAAEIQRLLHAAERQVDSINRELHKRPTSTGVRYRLLWQPLPEEEGAPAGLDAARKHLFNSHWHRFRVERWQDGHWRKLSGPASSGERALGLTVPLFAAVASFYSQGGYALAPRLMLLDQAFAGINDTARAHCMELIREFDLDFVVTSEREWACYADLPGVAICQLQRREGIDAVFVSRWTWDGARPWRFGAVDYLAAVLTAPNPAHTLVGIAEGDMGRGADACHAGTALSCREEAVATSLLDDLGRR